MMPRLPKNIVKRGNRFYFRSKEGGRDRRVSLGPNLQEAKRKALLLAFGQQPPARQESQPHCPTLREFSSQWLTEYIRQSRNTSGADLADRRLRKHTLPVLGAVQIRDITPMLLRKLRTRLEEKLLAPFTVRHVLSDVRCLLSYAVEVGALETNPFRASVMPKIPETAPRRLTDEELLKVISATPDRYKTAVELAALTGLRWGELRRLEWRHIVWGESPHLVLDQTKSGKVRRVPLVPEAVVVLQREQGNRSKHVLPLRPLRTIEFVAPMRKQLGFYWTFHQLRHTFACRWLDGGGSKEALQKILGHSSISMTERYGRLSDEAVFAEAQGRTLGRPASGGTPGGTVGGTVARKQNARTP